MITVQIGDLFESNAHTLVNTVNCAGVMGKGIAQLFKKRYPNMFADYQARCDRNEVQPGVPYLYEYAWYLKDPLIFNLKYSFLN